MSGIYLDSNSDKNIIFLSMNNCAAELCSVILSKSPEEVVMLLHRDSSHPLPFGLLIVETGTSSVGLQKGTVNIALP